MTSKHKILLVLCIVALALLSVALLDMDSDPAGTYHPSSYSTRPGGYNALYLLLQELHLPASRLRKPYSRLEAHRGVLIVTDPNIVPFSAREIKKLKKWIKQGNRLIVFHGGPSYGPELPQWPVKKSKSGIRDLLEGFSLARKLGLRLDTLPNDSRSTVEVSSPQLFGVSRISVARKSRWKKPAEEWKSIVSDDVGPVIVIRQLERGEVVAISDATMVSNRDIADGQNARAILSLLLEKGQPQEIIFDEYHHGYSLADSFWSYVASSIFAWVLLQIMVGCALFFYARRASYAGRIRSLAQPSGRSSLEYVDSMAHIFESSKAGALALDGVLRRFLGRLSRITGIPLKRLDERSLRQTEIRSPDGIDVKGLIEECRMAVRSGADTHQTLTLARRLAETRARLTGWSTQRPSTPRRPDSR